ncbi:transporter [Bordetella sp. J329]|jgi:predicted permease|uniref:AEC family transporter n=3 Tax=Kerstersia gyiorum TaxID=206506 RepID=UPI000FD7004C|nr:AEC family transporter [Kerstersia gyiorum]AZV93212.1 transporter [Bordetella sp. J329]MCI1228096.1 AEC family transporter [Kerstersia gyiorum]
MLTQIVMAALGPIVVGGAVGWLSGKYGFIKRDYSQAFADFVVKIALPIALFLAALSSSPSSILNADFALAMAAGLVIAYVVAYVVGKVIYKHNRADSTMQALSASFPDMAYCGPPILLATVGSSGLIAMVIGNLIYTVIILPIALMMIGGDNKGQSAWKSFGKSLSQPLVFLPILGAVLAIAGVEVPDVIKNSLNELGKTAGGVALFFLGLFLSGIKMNVRSEIVFNVIVKNILQGAVILGVGLALGLEGMLLKSAFIIGILPTATATPALAVANNVYKDEAASTVLLSTLVSLVTMTLGIVVVSEWL